MKIISLFQIIVSLFLIILILLQQREGGLSSIFGGEGGYFERRGAEKFIFNLTIILAALFLGLSLGIFL